MLADDGPGVTPILEHERLRDELPCERGRRIADPEHIGREPDVVRPVTHLVESRQQSIAQQHVSTADLMKVEVEAQPLNAITINRMRPDVEHKALGPRQVRCFVLTVSDTRTDATDTGGRAIADLLTGAGHRLTGRAIVKDEPPTIREAIVRQIGSGDAEVVITTGGTGVTSRDSTFEVVRALLNKELTGFGELFRMLSYQEIGPAAMMSRATAGLAGRCVIVALPGSEAAVRLAMEKLLLPELGHLVQQASR